ncbi:MAG: ABC transporter ATP-binding protein [Anaerolineae bacterium]
MLPMSSRTPILQIEALSYHYPPLHPGSPGVTALSDISCELRAGSCLAVTGPNGGGLTTLCLAVTGLMPRMGEGRITGRILVEGRDVQQEPPGALADQIGLVMQDPGGQLFNASVEQEVAWGLENLGLPPDEMRKRITWALGLVGLSDIPPNRSPRELSGGQQKRLALAAALALRPRLLVLDEPAGGLSPAARTEMIRVLRDLRARFDLAILIAERDPEVITALADQVMVLANGRVARQGSPADVYAGLAVDPIPGVALPPSMHFTAALKEGWAAGPPCLTLEEVLARVPMISPNSPPSALDDPGSRPADAAAPAVILEGVTFAYQPGHPVLHQIDLSIPRGQRVALMGDNGAGKTTLARHLIGLLRPTTGRVVIMGEDAAGCSVGHLARSVGLAFQSPELQIFSATVREEIAFGPRNLGLGGPALDTVVEEALHLFNLTDIAEMPPSVLTFGIRRMVALASIAAMRTPILVLDEPTVGLDALGQGRVLRWLAERHRAGATILLITHDAEIAAAFAERVIVMQAGRITADGAPSDVFARADLLADAGLEPPFAVRLALARGRVPRGFDLTPVGAARAWREGWL